jgi:hypothetical protein
METEFDLSLLSELESLKKFKDFTYEYFQDKAPEIEKKRKEKTRLESELAIVKEQEGETNTEIEEKNLLYWENGLDQHKNYLSSIQTLEEQLRAMKDKYERKKVFFETRIQNARSELERKKSKKSKGQIKFSMKIAEVEKELNDYDEASRGFMRYNELVEKVGKAFQSAKQKQMKSQAEKYKSTPTPPAPTPAPPPPPSDKPTTLPILQNTKAKKKAKQVAVATEPDEE